MTDMTTGVPAARPTKSILSGGEKMRRRHAAETRFKLYGLASISFSLGILALMMWTIFSDGISAFKQAKISFPLTLSSEVLDPSGTGERAEMTRITTIAYQRLLSAAFIAELQAKGISTEGVSDKELGDMLSKDAPGRLRGEVMADTTLLDTSRTMTVLANGRIDGYLKGRVSRETAERDAQISPATLDLVDRMIAAGMLTTGFNLGFLTNSDASDQRPEAAGLGVAILGSAYMMLLVLIICVPTGVAASVYLEEFAPKNRWTDVIEVNISNLAAVPSIVYGILGLAVFINFAKFPQSSPLVGALVLSLMTLPTIIIASRAAIRAVPPSIRDAALGVGASKMQTVFHHVLPLAAPGILTGTILGLASALGETAPLLLIGMVAFVDNYPGMPIEGFLDPATALPVQVYSWASRSDPAFIERSSGAIIVLLAFLVTMNVTAIILRRKFERRW